MNPICIVTKFYPIGSLRDFLETTENIPLDTKLNIISGITAGMLHLEKENLVHRDLAARNILLTAQLEAVISDFGFARALKMNANEGNTASDIGPVRWMSPEELDYRTYSIKSDVWSWGVTVWEIFNKGDLPFREFNLTKTCVEISSGKIQFWLTFPSDTPFHLIELVKTCWDTQSITRPSFQQISEVVEAIMEALIEK